MGDPDIQPAHRAQRALASVGLRAIGSASVPDSTARFDDGRPFRIEIPSVEGPDALAAILETAAEFGIRVDRVSQGSGIMLQTDEEIGRMLALGAEHDVEICLFVGPRGAWDIGAQAATLGGRAVAAALRGDEQLRAAVEDVQHGCELGLRCVLVADIGLLHVLGRLRAAGTLPADLRFKVSASFPVSNPATARLLEDLGADSLNIAVDLSVPQIAGLRRAVSIPLDIYVEGPDDFGAPVRYHDVPEMVRTAAPVHLKFAVRNAASLYPYGRHLHQHLLDTARERVRRAALAVQLLNRLTTTDQVIRTQIPL
jgi:peptidase U32-like protein